MPEAGSPGPRAWLPPALLLALAAGSFCLYQLAPPGVAAHAIYPYAACLALGPYLVYSWMRRRGASPAAAAAGTAVVPVAWLVKEGYRITGVFGIADALYYALNPLALGIYLATLFQLALWEIALRRPWSATGRRARGPLVLLAGVLLCGAALGLAAYESGGSEIFYTFVAIHARLLGE